MPEFMASTRRDYVLALTIRDTKPPRPQPRAATRRLTPPLMIMKGFSLPRLKTLPDHAKGGGFGAEFS